MSHFVTVAMSTSYRELLGQVVPRPIGSNAAYQRALRQIELLMRKPRRTRAEDDMVALLAMLIERYEIGLGYDTPQLSPRDRLMGLIEARGWSQTELARQSGVPRPTINEILSGKRAISKRAAIRFARCFRAPAEEFLDDV
jgi:HTH-type transcriptional regulator / antitoxin HigA